MDKDITIRMATTEDAEEILRIYAPYVQNTAITFEYDVPSLEEFAKRIENTLMKYPYLVALENGQIAGYAYASMFKARIAYSWAVETSIYIKRDCRGKGIGKTLYQALEDILKRQHVINLNASIAYTEKEDEHLDQSSIRFHEYFGYQKVAHFTKCGYKFGNWYDMVWMEKMLGEHPDKPEPFIPITQIGNEISFVLPGQF
ncbi:MAG TPA: N-acetyltransferase family protein [Oscillospiraceae bacterium]|nr:N-acetyltransferase family protein [Oscillospiraceae bacterium]HPK35549.1 N-acetyltransferase family protein [Oscillospiraceae bacterium]HPR75911.1 N-acetyltransferase family protein [Oscillospiraceae bacterium]